MTSPSGVSGTIHLVVGNDRRRDRLEAGLSGLGYSVTQGLDGIPANTDLCLLDADGAETVGETLRKRKQAARPIRLPALLIQSSNGETPPAEVGDLDGAIDDILVAPYDQAEIRHRIETLLRTRRLSIEATVHRRQYRELVGSLSEAVFMLRLGRVEYVNEAGRRLLGDDADVTGRQFLDLVHPDDRASVKEAFGGDGPAGSFQQVRLLTNDGSVVTVELTGAGTVSESGSDLPRQIVVRERRSREYAREMAREQIQGTLERISDGFVAIDEEWRITYSNEQAEVMLGYTADDLVGTSVWSVLPTSPDRQFESYLGHAMSSGEAVTFEEHYTPLDSWFEVNVYPAQNGLSVYFRDVTERKERKRELERFETIVQTASDPIFTLDPDRRFATVNEEMLAFTGYDRDRLLGAHLSLVLPEEDLDRAAETLCHLETDEAEDRRSIEITVETANHESRTCEASVALLPSEGGDPVGAVGVLHDLTDRIRREQRLSVLDRVLRHNLRNKMNVIVGRVDGVLTDTWSDEDIVDHVREIRRVAEDLLTLGEEARRFQDVLDADADQAVVLDLATTAATVIDEVRADHPEVTIDANLPATAPVRASTVIELALEEVLENAIIHNDRDDPRVGVDLVVDDDWVTVEVTDDGPGIPPEEVAVLETGTETALDHGSGLGLWLIYWTVTKYGGEVTFDADGDRGTTVRLWLPRAETTDDPL